MSADVQCRQTANFQEWLKRVDAWCIRLSGLSMDSMDDYCYADMFALGYTPLRAAKRAVRYAIGNDN